MEKHDIFQAYNVWSSDFYREKMFEFDLQLFGGGGGKSVGKALLTIGFAAFGYFNATAFGFATNMSIGGALLGASIGSALWGTTHQDNANDFNSIGSPDVQRFDRAQETMSSEGVIPVVYGYRKITGNQTYHQANSEANQLHKHVVLCEGGIEGIEGVTANDLLIPTGTQTSSTVFTIQNVKYENAYASIAGKTLSLTANTKQHSVYLCNKDDAQNAGSYYEWQINTSALISYINRLGDGWQAFPCATTSKYPGDLSMASGNCYNKPLNVVSPTVVGGSSYTFHDCEPPSNYEEVGGYPGMAWLDMTLSTSSDMSGNPSVAVNVKGKKVFDPRNGKTEYSTNPALCLRDFILSKRYGLGKWFTESIIDDDSWNEAADYCDEIITFQNADDTYVDAKRYELNMVIDQSNTAINWIQEILANFSGYLVFANGKLKLRIEKAEPISYRFNDNNCSELSIAPIKLSETPNKYEVKIIDPGNNWSAIACLCEDYADQKERGRVVAKEVQLNGVTSQSQALRLARFYRDYNLACPLNVSFKTGYQALHLEPGDVVTISFHNIFNDMPIRISEIRENEGHEFVISGRQYNAGLYTDKLGGGIQWYNYTTAKELVTVEPENIIPKTVSNLKVSSHYRSYSDGTDGYEIRAEFSLPSYANRVEVEYKTNDVSADTAVYLTENVPADELGYQQEWTKAGDGITNVVFPAQLGSTYTIRACAVAANGNKSSYCEPRMLKVTAKETVPSKPYNLRFNFNQGFRFEWNDIPDTDAIYYELRTDEKVGSIDGLLGRTNDTSIEVSLSSRTGTAYLYAVNSMKVASYPATVYWNKPFPNAPVITSQSTLTGTVLSVGMFNADIRKVTYYITGTTNGYSDVVKQETPSYLFEAKPDIYEVKASLTDVFGEGIISAPYMVTIEPTFDAKYIEDGTLSIEKVDSLLEQKIKEGVAASEAVVSIVKELGKSPEESVYSAITQLHDAINLRVKADDIVNQINMTAKGTTIDGKYLHVTGDTKFDNNVIVGGMIKAGAITADKLSSTLISLGGGQGIKGGSTTLDANGMTCIASDGNKVLFNSGGMQFVDKNGITFGNVGRMVIGVASHGQRVTFAHPWSSIPKILVAPITHPLSLADYTSQNVYDDNGATDITINGFTMNCRTILANGTGITTSKTCRATASTGTFTFDLGLNPNATSGTINLSKAGLATGDEVGKPAFCSGTYTLDIQVLLNGKSILHMSESEYTVQEYAGVGLGVTDVLHYSEAGSGSASFKCNKNSTLVLKLTVSASGSIGSRESVSKARPYATVSTSWVTNGNTEISKNSAMFIAIENNTSEYTVS